MHCPGERHIRHQREIIRFLASGGHDITAAEALVRQLEEVQAVRIADRDRLLKLSGAGGLKRQLYVVVLQEAPSWQRAKFQE